ncbi:hypothetical protein ACGF12_34130 [Kitasatospora sp. NPDC048296]|uniref:hypothetical protein n=1 Tax=Kitasatospora sp. NPDC048296 TaxID=3364048 RepID=UPI0037206A68
MTDDEKAEEDWKKKEEEKRKQKEKEAREKQDQKEKDDANSFKVTENFLLDFAHTKLSKMLEDLKTHPTRLALKEFVLGIGGGKFSGDYAKLLPGGGPAVLPSTKALQDAFTAYCTALEAQFKTLEDQVQAMIDDLESAQTTLNHGGDDALAAAEMIYLVSDVLGGGGGIR